MGASLLLGTVGSAWAAGNVVPKPAVAEQIEVIVVTAKRPSPDVIDEVIVIGKRPTTTVVVRTPPAMPIELPRVEFAIAAPPVVRL